MTAPLTILYRDHDFIAVDKPVGMIVHRAGNDDNQPALLQTLRDQVGERIYPIHRLDQPTSGVVLFGFDPTAAAAMVEQFTHHRVRKFYQTIVAGWTSPEGCITTPLADGDGFEADKRGTKKRFGDETALTLGPSPIRMGEQGKTRAACTVYSSIRRFDVPSIGSQSNVCLSWVEASPQSGRWHQIRRHLSSIGHPILGDYRHGCEEFNTWLETVFQTDTMMLSSVYLAFEHPFLGHEVIIRGPRHSAFTATLNRLLPHGVTLTESTSRS